MTTLKWHSGTLVIHDAPEDLKGVLGYWHKTMVSDGMGGRMSDKVWCSVFHEEAPGVLMTYQGFLDRVRRKLGDRPYQVEDHREVLPRADLFKAKGFIHFQREVFLAALAKTRSGLIKIPTRTGKSYLALNYMRIWPNIPTVYAAPGVDLLRQQMEKIEEEMPEREVKGLFSGATSKGYSEDITVCSFDSLEKLPADQTRLLLIDEPHAAVSPQRLLQWQRFDKARIYGLGATVSGRFDCADIMLEGVMGPVLVEKTFAQAVAAGAICPIVVYLVKLKVTPHFFRNRDQAYRKMIYENTHFNKLITQLVDKVIPQDWQTLVFIDEIRQGALMAKAVEGGVVAIASNMSTAERKANFAGMADGSILRGISTDIYSTGVTFSHLRVMINAAGGGGSISSTQKPGRLAQIMPGKACGYVIDFQLELLAGSGPSSAACDMVIRDSRSREAAYRSNGYELREVNSLDEIKLV